LARFVTYLDGFFDAGMLLQALKSSEEAENPSEKAAVNARRNVGRKLRLADY
jgi:carnitine O-acetyltransferase